MDEDDKKNQELKRAVQLSGSLLKRMRDGWTHQHLNSAQQDEGFRQRVTEYHWRFRRFLVGGAAGGLVLSVTVCAALLGREKGALIPWPLFLIVLVFLAAIIVSAFLIDSERDETVANALRAAAERVRDEIDGSKDRVSKHVAEKMVESLPRPPPSGSRRMKLLQTALVLLLALGVGLSIVMLGQLTAFP